MRHVRRIPRAARVAALVALVNAVVWSLLIPPLQSFDEPVHVYYGQFLAETYNVPRPVQGSVISEEEIAIMNGTKLLDVVGNPDGAPPWTEIEDRELNTALASGLGRVSQGADGGVGSYPPLFYGLGAVAYKLTPERQPARPPRGDAPRLRAARGADRAVRRACSCASCCRGGRGRRRRPGSSPRSSRSSASCRASSTRTWGSPRRARCMFFAVARAWRRGLTWQLGLVIGLALAAGFLSKLAMAAMVPGAALAVLLLAWRWKAWRGLIAFAAGARAAGARLHAPQPLPVGPPGAARRRRPGGRRGVPAEEQHPARCSASCGSPTCRGCRS